GTIVQEGELFVEVRAVGSQTKVQNILTMIDKSQQLKVSSQVRSERLADSLVKYNFLLSLGVLLFTRNMSKVMATLMVDYSCAMKLASPIAVLSAMKEAAENGIIVKGGKFLEDASIADTVVFDKTGTLTAATPAVSRIITFGGRKEDDVLATAACLEEHFAHPVAAAVVKAANERGLLHPENHAKVEYIVAHGIATTLKGKKLVIGSRHFVFDDEKVQEPEELKKIQKDALKNGESLLYLAEEKELIGIFAVNDPVRKNAPEIIQKLHQSGIKNCVMITGDDEGAARNAAKITKIDHYISRALPEDKFNYIEKQKKLGHKVIMIGDGINDAPALAAADTGIAMGDCADITGETADIILSSEDGLERLYKTRLLGTGLMRKIDVNNGGIVAVNTTFMLLGLFGFISPSLAAILHNASTVAFSVNAMRPVLAGKEGA
ncbi:MAG: heavy metal translocating P-type ATPase, partial [Spirochaetaceae bacterium]|nr:heavy metal translocating P-type ATPase [Spirochaetaceae bacterium]